MTTLTFQNTTLSVINQNNQIWLTTSEVGKALGYSNPLKAIATLFDRHQDEFTPNMTALVDMQTAGGIQKVRIFSLRGCHLIGMLSHTKVAKDFRKWVLDILDRETAQPKQLALPEPEPTINVEFKVSELRKIVNVWLQFTRFAESVYFLIRALGLNNDSAKHDERSVVFNHNLCKQNIKDTTLIIKRLALQLPEPPKRLTKPNF